MRRLGKLDKSNLGSFRRGVLSSLHPSGSGFFNSSFDMHQPLLSTVEREEGVQKLYDSLPTGGDVIYRGTIGKKEIEHAMKTNRLGMDFKESKKDSSLDVVAFIRENNSKYLLSYSPCSQTVQPYAAGLSFIPCQGFIWVTGLPTVFTRPQKLLYLNRSMFERYDERQIEMQDRENPSRYVRITDMTANNNEVTAILGGPGEDWRQNVTQDVIKLVQVAGPGMLGKFMSSNEIVHVKDWGNPDYRKKVWSMDVVISGGPNPLDDYAKMNEIAREMRLISADERLLTIEDARAVVNSGLLDSLNDNYGIDTTHCFTKVPKNIAVGDVNRLVEYLNEEITLTNALVEIEAINRSVIE